MRAGPRPPRPIGDAFHERLNFGPEDTLGWSAGRSGRAWIFDWRSDRSLSPHHVGIPRVKREDGRARPASLSPLLDPDRPHVPEPPPAVVSSSQHRVRYLFRLRIRHFTPINSRLLASPLGSPLLSRGTGASRRCGQHHRASPQEPGTSQRGRRRDRPVLARPRGGRVLLHSGSTAERGQVRSTFPARMGASISRSPTTGSASTRARGATARGPRGWPTEWPLLAASFA